MKILVSVFTVAAVVVLATIGFAYSGIYDISARSNHSAFLHWLLTTTSHASVERRSKSVDVPNLDDANLRLAGVNDYAAMCAGCHGAPGREPEATGQGLNPLPPDLAESAEHMSPAELFWVTKNGIRMTGMPAWGVTHEDKALWPVVAFLTILPELDAAAYQTLLISASGLGHHATGHDHGDAGAAADQTHDRESAAQHDNADTADDAHEHPGHSHADSDDTVTEETKDDGHSHQH